MTTESKCPFTGGGPRGQTNRGWWPNQLDLSVLHDNHQAKALYASGYRAPHRRAFPVAGRSGIATITAQLVNTFPPLARSASAISGTATKGSARPSLGV